LQAFHSTASQRELVVKKKKRKENREGKPKREGEKNPNWSQQYLCPERKKSRQREGGEEEEEESRVNLDEKKSLLRRPGREKKRRKTDEPGEKKTAKNLSYLPVGGGILGK